MNVYRTTKATRRLRAGLVVILARDALWIRVAQRGGGASRIGFWFFVCAIIDTHAAPHTGVTARLSFWNLSTFNWSKNR